MSVDPRDIDAWCDAATLRLSPRDVAVKRLREEVRVRGHGAATAAEPATSPTFTDALAIGATSIADVEKLVEELLTARDYLQSEGEHVRLVNARYGRMAKSASARSISSRRVREMAWPRGGRPGACYDAPSTDPIACSRWGVPARGG